LDARRYISGEGYVIDMDIRQKASSQRVDIHASAKVLHCAIADRDVAGCRIALDGDSRITWAKLGLN
jgi:hypothetical protein